MTGTKETPIEWPFNGISDCPHNLETVLSYTKKTQPSQNQLIDWIISNRRRANEAEINRHLSFLECIGVINLSNSKVTLGPHGRAWFTGQKQKALYTGLNDRLEYFGALLRLLKDKAHKPKEIHNILDEKPGERKISLTSVTKRLEWLQMLGAVERDELCYRITTTGHEFFSVETQSSSENTGSGWTQSHSEDSFDNPRVDGHRSTKDGQREVMLLGTYHFEGSKADKYGKEVDILHQDTQRQLEELTDRFVDWDPDAIGIEQPPASQQMVNQAFQAWVAGNVDKIPDSLSVKDESVQIGMRLAAKLGHNRVLAVDHELPLKHFQSEVGTLPEPENATYPLPDIEEEITKVLNQDDSMSVIERLRFVNKKSKQRINDSLLVGASIEASEVGEYAETAVTWYQRNIRIVANLWDAIEEGTDRIVLVFGSSHIPTLHHILDQAPMFDPISSYPILQAR